MDLIHKRVMLNNRNQTTVKVITQQRYITHLHKVAYNRKYSVIVPLNYKRDGFIETVHFNCWRQTSSCQGLLTYIEDFVAIVHKCDHNPYKYDIAQSLYHDYSIPGLPYSTNKKKMGDMPLRFWRNYFESYEVETAANWVISSPYADELNLPAYLDIKPHINGKIKLIDRFALK